jgi:hypothetical protein
VGCAQCRRLVCRRHADSIARADGGRCALCRLQAKRRTATLTRRLWYGAAIAGFLLIDGFAIHANPAQGLALLLIVPLVALLAFLYDRSLRRGTPLLALPRRRTPAAPRTTSDGESPPH